MVGYMLRIPVKNIIFAHKPKCTRAFAPPFNSPPLHRFFKSRCHLWIIILKLFWRYYSTFDQRFSEILWMWEMGFLSTLVFFFFVCNVCILNYKDYFQMNITAQKSGTEENLKWKILTHTFLTYIFSENRELGLRLEVIFASSRD